MIVSLIPIFLLIDGPKPGSSYLPGKSRQAYCSYCSRVTLISKPIHFIIYGGGHLISMQEIQFSMQEDTDEALN